MIRLALTPGEPAGIGPELVVRYAQRPLDDTELVVVADPELLATTAGNLGLPLRITAPGSASGDGSISVLPVPLAVTNRTGTPNTGNARYVLDTLRVATQACLEDRCDALITGPVHKGVINDAGVAFSGHTEYFAELCGVARVVMMLATEGLRVALATTHLPLRAVSDAISTAGLKETLAILVSDLQTQFGIARPRILVAGLNPHAGEGGHLGREEIDVISPAINDLRHLACELIGPLPADTLFTPQHLASADAVLAMYHDQGLPVLKYKGFGRAVNITLGLPFIRTSVDHGTALDIAGRGVADLGSLETAIATALTMAASRRVTQVGR